MCSAAAPPAGSGEVTVGEPNSEAAPKPPNGDAGELTFHPLAILPMLDEASQLAMARDIRERGQFEAIVLYQKQILDGRCRYRAAYWPRSHRSSRSIRAMIPSVICSAAIFTGVTS